MSQPLHHPQDDLLASYASGSLDVAMTLIVGTHLHFCAVCRKEVAEGERIGGILLETGEAQALSPDAWSKMLAKLDAPQPSVAVSNDNVPALLRAFMGKGLDEVRWRKLGSNLAYVPLYRSGRMRVRLLRGKPGTDTGRHSHKGVEYTQVLAGGFTDETGSYGPGDFQCADDAVSHNPVADHDGEDCINLSVTTDGLRFEGWVPAIVGRLFGF